METKNHSLDVSMEALSPLMREILAAGGTVELTTTGGSMRPMLLHRVSKVRLAPPRPLQCGDIPLYIRDNGAYVLHRVVDRAGENYTLCGDAQWRLEPGIRPDQILAVVTDFCRRRRWVSCASPGYRIYWRAWVFVRPLRRLVFGGARRLLKCIRKIWK